MFFHLVIRQNIHPIMARSIYILSYIYYLVNISQYPNMLLEEIPYKMVLDDIKKDVVM